MWIMCKNRKSIINKQKIGGKYEKSTNSTVYTF